MKGKWIRAAALLALLLMAGKQSAIEAQEPKSPVLQSHPIIADSLFVYGPTVHTFDVYAFFAEHAQAVSTYSEMVQPLGTEFSFPELETVELSAPEIVEYVAHHYSLNPQLLLTLLELKSGFFTSDRSTPEVVILNAL